MDIITIFKALSNETRMDMLTWLKEPRRHFPAEDLVDFDEKLGVCVSDISRKAGLSPSTTSDYLSMLQKCGLVTASRSGQWTYYKRNEKAITQLHLLIKKSL